MRPSIHPSSRRRGARPGRVVEAGEQQEPGVRGHGSGHPERWVLLAAAGAWAWMAALPARPGGHGGHAGHGHGGSVGPWLLGTALMVVAMMLPMTLTSVRHVVSQSAGPRRHRALAGFLTSYAGVWMLAMAVIGLAWTAATSRAGWTTTVIVLIVAATLWEVAPAKRRHVERCRHTPPIAPHGWRADADCARHGVAAGLSCIASCWALMAACVAFAHSLPVMAALFGVQVAGRSRHRLAPVLSAATVLAVCLAALAARSAAGHGA